MDAVLVFGLHITKANKVRNSTRSGAALTVPRPRGGGTFTNLLRCQGTQGHSLVKTCCTGLGRRVALVSFGAIHVGTDGYQRF